MQISKTGKRLLSVVLALAMMVSLFSGIGSVLTASADPVEKVDYMALIADAEHPYGNEANRYVVSPSSYSVSEDSGDYDVVAYAKDQFDKYDGSIRYTFSNWTDPFTATRNSGSYEFTLSSTSIDDEKVSFSFETMLDVDTITVYNAVYDANYRVRFYGYDYSDLSIERPLLDSAYVAWYDDYYIPYYEGIVPAGHAFVAWKDVDTGILYAPGTSVETDHPVDYIPWFVETDELPGYFVYFKDYTTGQIYDIKYYNPETDDLYTAAAPEKEGYTFDCWYIADSEYDALEYVPNWAPDKTTFYARWTPDTYHVYSDISGDAYVNISETSAYYGERVEFEVGTTKDNANISKIEITGNGDSKYIPYSYYDYDIGEGGYYVFTMPAADVTIHVETSTTEYTVTFLDENGGYYATRTVAAGESLSFWEMPFAPFKTGYTFDGWKVVNNDNPFAALFGNNSFTYDTPVNGNLFVKASYVGNTYRVYKADDCDEELEYLYVRSGEQDKDLTDEPANYVEAKAGDTVTIEVAPTPTYNITGIAVRQRGTGDYVVAPTLLRKYKDAENNDCYVYAFEMPTNNIEIAVYVAANTYTVHVEEFNDENGTFRINGYDTTNLGVPQGDYAEIEIIPEEGYYVADVSSYYYDENGNVAYPYDYRYSYGGDIVYYGFDMVSSDVYVRIDYAPYDYTVNVKNSNEDTFKPVWDGDKYITIESLDDEETSKGLVILCDTDGTPYEAYESIGDPHKNCLLPQNYTDSNVGDQICFKIKEFIGYDLANVIVTYADGTKTVPTTLKDGIYYFTMPADNVFIKATFVEETYKVTKATDCEEYNTDAEHAVMGEVNIKGLREKIVSADYKELVEVTATPKAGYYVESISYELKDGTNKDGETVVDFSEATRYDGAQLTDTADTTQSIEFYMPACDVEIFVTYGKIEYSIQTEVASGDETGTITVNDYANYDDEVTCTVTPEYGYVLSKINVKNLATGKTISIKTDTIDRTYGDEFYFDMPASSVKITATFVKDKYSVIYKDTNNTVIGIEDPEIFYKETATLYPEVVSVPNGYHFVGWISFDTETPVTEPSLDPADFVIIKNTTIYADYDYDKTNVCFEETENGYVAPADSTDKTNEGDVWVGDYEYQDTVYFDIVPDEGYVIDTIEVYGSHKDGDKYIHIDYFNVTGDTYCFDIPALYKSFSNNVYTYPAYVEVTFKKDTFDLTKDFIGENGTVEVNGNVTTDDTYTYEFHDIVTITATPDKGYFVESIVATMVDTTATNTEGGEYSYTYYGTVPANDVYGTTQSISFPMPATDMTYTVTYAKCNFTITSIVESGAETGTLVAPTLKQIDDEIVFTITPSYGYIVDTLSVTDNQGNVVFDTTDIDRTYGGTYKFVMPASPVIISVNYIKDAYVVTYKDSDNSVIFTESIKFEETATLGVTPEVTPSGNHFIGWVSADTKVPVTTASLNTADFVINKATTITAVYETDNTKVVFKKTVNGSAYNDDIAIDTTKTGDQSHVYKYGDTINFKVAPDEGYAFYEVKVTCKAIDGVATNYVPVNETADGYSFVIPAIHKNDVFATDTDDLIVEVTFCKDEYTLYKKEAYNNGTVEINGAVDTEISYTYKYLQLVTITATPDKGYYVKSIVAAMDTPVNTTEDAASGYTYIYEGTAPAYGVDGEAQTIKFPMPATDMNYVVIFDKCEYNITVVTKSNNTLGDHGVVTTDPASIAKPGDIVTVTVDPDDGYSIAAISVVDDSNNAIALAFDSEDINHIAKYTFTMPSANVTITATFKQAASREYIDVRDDAWYYDAITFVSDRGYFKGYGTSGEIFGPVDKITRQDFVLVIARMNGVDLTPYEGRDTTFVDVNKNAYYAPALAWAVENGIITGYKDGSNRFGVGDYITRQDIVTILYRYAKFMGYQTELTPDAITQKETRYSVYTDLAYVGTYAQDAMAWGVGFGVLKGTSNTKLSPTKNASRSEVAQMIKNLYDHNIAR